MKRRNNYQDLYNEILRCLYIGVYKNGDKLPTVMQYHQLYDTSTYAIQKAFKMLIKDGFIYTKTSNGTIATFDLNNPKHMEKMPFYCHDPRNPDFDTFIVPPVFISTIITQSLKKCSSDCYVILKDMIDTNIYKLQHGTFKQESSVNLVKYLCSQLDNEYLTEMVKDFLERYLIPVPEEKININSLNMLKLYYLDLYEEFKKCLENNTLNNINKVIREYYTNLYQISGVFVFYKRNNDKEYFKQQSLYTKLLYNCVYKIASGEYKKGDFLPTKKQICQTYNVGMDTVRKSRTILSQLGVISIEKFSGTKLIIDWNNEKNRNQFILEILGKEKKRIADSLEAIEIMTSSILEFISTNITTDMIDKIRYDLECQYTNYQLYNIPMYILDIIITPIMMISKSAIIRSHYFYTLESLTNFMAMGAIRGDQDITWSKSCYLLACRALDYIKKGDKIEFSRNILLSYKKNMLIFRGIISKELLDEAEKITLDC